MMESSDDDLFEGLVDDSEEQRALRLERLNRRRNKVITKDKKIMSDWFQMTGQTIDSKDLDRLRSNYFAANKAPLCWKDFERMKKNWLLLTGCINSNNFDKLKRDYLLSNWARINSNDLEQLRKYWMLFTGDIDPSDLEKLKGDYLALNWTKMSTRDFKRFRTNWLLLTERLGTDNLEDIVKTWLLHEVSYAEYRRMSNEEKLEFTRMCLERGVDVNALNRAGYSLLQMVIGDKLMMLVPLVDLLLRYGADVNVRTPSGMTPLDTVRIYYYKDYEDIINLLQTATKPARVITLTDNDESPTNQPEEVKFLRQREYNEIQKQWIQTNESLYLSRASELFEQANMADIKNLLLSVINYMFVSKIQRSYYMKLKQGVKRHKNITKIHKIYSKMCSKLFNVFDPEFNKSIIITFPETGKLCDNAELVFLIEIHPEVEWVALKLFAIPSDLEYYIVCAAGSRIRFMLSRDHRNHFSICSENLLCRYEKYLSAHQQGFC